MRWSRSGSGSHIFICSRSSLEETIEYLDFQNGWQVGRVAGLFTPDAALQAMYELSEGVPQDQRITHNALWWPM